MRVLLLLSFLLATGWLRAQAPCDSMAAVMSQLISLYDSMATEQVEFAKLAADQRTQIDSLMAEVRRGKYAIAKAHKEAETLRRIMKGYITTVDSLYQSDRALRMELDELKKGPR